MWPASRRAAAWPAVAAWLVTATSLTIAQHQDGESYQPRTRFYYVAAEDVRWDYAPTGKTQIKPGKSMAPWGDVRVYTKTRYVECTDASFERKKPQPAHLGILDPLMCGVVGDTIKVHFKNRGSRPYSMHPHGLLHDKETDLHTPHWQGETVPYDGWRTDVINLLPATMAVADMQAENVGKWLYHCHVGDHITAGMLSLYEIQED